MSTMEMIYDDPYYANEYEGVKDYEPELSKLLKDMGYESKIVPTDLGHGADFPAYLVLLRNPPSPKVVMF